MNETTKAMRRRRESPAAGFWWRVFKGKGIDVGSGSDPLDLNECIHFDQKDGDANVLHTLFPHGSFDYIHASQSLEHMNTPDVLWDWMLLLRKGGHAIITVPSWELYEGMTWPSRFNGDHKSTWSMSLRGSPAPHHVHVPSWTASRTRIAIPIVARQLDVGYDYKLGPWVDQSLGDAEPWIEFVMQRT